MTDAGYLTIKLKQPDEKAASRFGLTAIDYSKGYLQISVRDTGIGISDEDMKYLCDPYAQLEKGKKYLLRAFQMGAASILVKRAGGYIYVRSEVMKGTRYDIIIPVEKENNE